MKFNVLWAAAILAVAACDASKRTPASTARAAEETAAVSIGRVDTLRLASGELFSSQMPPILMMRSGLVAAFDQDDKRVVLFDSTGKELRGVGRKGGGPGEFQYVLGLFALPGDSVAVWDAALRRLSYFDATLKFDRIEQFEKWKLAGGIESEIVGRLADGRWIARTTNSGNIFDGTFGVRAVVDTIRLLVGKSHETPTELSLLPLRNTLRVVRKSGSNSFNSYELRVREVFEGFGAVCERGVVLADTAGVRIVGSDGRVVHVGPLPRRDSSTMTSAQRASIIKGEMFTFDTMPDAGAIRRALEQIMGDAPRHMQPTLIDVTGRLWYDHSSVPHMPPNVIDRVDSSGRADISVRASHFGARDRIGLTSIAMIDWGTDMSDPKVLLARLPRELRSTVSDRLGFCGAPFSY